jgi:hypothetical protein
MADGNHTQTITVNYVATQAQREAAKFAADEQKRTKETAAVAAKAAKDTAAAQAKASRDATTAGQRAARELTASEKSEASARTSLDRQRSHALIANARAENAARRALDRQRSQALIKATQDEERATTASTAATMGYIAAYAGFSQAVAAVQSLSQYFAQLRADTFEAAKEVSNFREEVLELAAMKSQLGNSTPELIAQLKFRVQTGQSRQAALAMSTAAEGAGQAAIGKNLDQAAFDQGMLAAGQLQAMERSNPLAYGSLYGTLALEAKKGTTGDQMAGAINKEYQIQKPGKFLNMGQFAHQREQLTSYVQTGALSGPEASGLLSALSLENSPDQAATMAEQILASTSADFMRARGMKTLPGTEHETSAAYFQQHLGLKQTATAKETWEAAADDINKQQVAAAAKGMKFSADKYLVEHGLNNQQARRGYAAMAAVRSQGQWDQFQNLIDAPLESGAIGATFDERRGRDQTIQKQLGVTAHEASMINASEGTAEGGLKELQEAAFDRVKARHGITGTFAEWKNRNAIGIMYDDLFGSAGGHGGYHEQVDLEAQKMLGESAKKAGIDFTIPSHQAGVGRIEDYMGDEALYRKQQQIQKAGGDPLADIAKDIKTAMEAAQRSADAIEKKLGVAPGKPAAAPVKPLVVVPPAAGAAVRGP